MPSRCLAAALAAALVAAPACAAEPFAALDLIWVTPSADRGATPACARPLVLETPPGWVPGDAAAVLLGSGPGDEALAVQVAQVLIAEETAVLHLVPGDRGGIGACVAAPVEPVAEILGALEVLKRQAGAGVVVAIGLGAAGGAVLEAAEPAVAADHLGEDGPRLAAGVALGGPGRAAFRAGTPPDARENWAARVTPLCAALAPLAGPGGADVCLAGLRGEAAVASLHPRR